MGDAEDTGYRLEHLRERWESDPTSRVFVQLAEEHRRRGEPERALEVLKAGLEHHPSYLSAQVALTRCYLETSRPGDALEVLETVLERDPTHLVAGKLMVKAHLARGDRDAAGEALERYRVLGGPEEEVETLEDTIRGFRGVTAVPEPEGEPTTGPERETPSERTGGSQRASGVRPESPDPARNSSSEGTLFRLPSPPEDRPPAWPAPPPEGTRALRGGEEAPIRLERPGREARYLEGLAQGDVLPFRMPESSPGVPTEIPREEELAQGEPEAPPAPEPREPPPEEIAEAQEEEREAPADAEEEVPPGKPDIAEVPERTTEGPGEAAATDLEPEPRPAEEPQPVSERPATATLGDLYLRQGYLDEAESIYREVLRREPDHEAARRGLETVHSRRRQWLTAEEILEDVGTELKGVTARKTELLRRYMTRLKEGAGRDVPGETA